MNTPVRITTDKVMSVYSGKNGKCCCGCAGKHYYASQFQKQASEHRGYEVTDDEVSDRMVKRVVGIINAAASVEVEPSFISAVVGERLYIAYRRDNSDDLHTTMASAVNRSKMSGSAEEREAHENARCMV